jgi:MFS family permease
MSSIKLGIRENLAQFSLLVLVNACVGAMIGMERSILPQIAVGEFHLAAKSAILSFIVVFGIAKALTNYLAGHFSDRFGRKQVLITGWIIAVPVPFLLMFAPSWTWILFANALLGVSQGLTWSTTVIMKIDLSGSKNRGFAMGLNEFAGYFAVAISALTTGWIAANYGLRPEPFYLGIAFVVLGLGLSTLLVKETKCHVALEMKQSPSLKDKLTAKDIFWRTTLSDKNLSSISQAGLINNLNDGMAWGLFPLFFSEANMTISQIGVLAAIYPATWGISQLFTGAWSDRVGRKWLIVTGMWIQAIGIAVVIVSRAFFGFAAGGVLLGVGTAMVYPTLLAAIGDVAHPSWRASSVGVYRLWRDLGYAIGAILAGVTADAFGLPIAMFIVGALTFLSGTIAAFRMSETLNTSKISKGTAFPCIKIEELCQILAKGLPIAILDVRPSDEFRAGHIIRAINIPLDTLSARFGELSKEFSIITVCGKGGGRSEQAAATLRNLGFVSARSLCGGTQAWNQAEKTGVING